MNKIFCSALTAVVAGTMLTGCAMPWEKGADDDVAPGGYSYTADSNSEQKQAYRWLIEPTINADNIISFDGSQVDPNNEKNTAYANYSVIRQNGKYGMVNKVQRGQRMNTDASMNSSDVRNILLIGSDTRNADERGRTDSMILLSINSTTKEITMTSFMRDMYVNIKGIDADGNDIDTWSKLNAAYVYGGAELLMDTIEYNFDIAVDDYVYIDFLSFVDIVDAVGGIELDISDEEAEGMKPPMAEQNKLLGNKKGTDYLDKGGKKLHVNGNQALAYARLRYVGNADFQRTERQRTVITKIIEKAKSSDPLTMT